MQRFQKLALVFAALVCVALATVEILHRPKVQTPPKLREMDNKKQSMPFMGGPADPRPREEVQDMRFFTREEGMEFAEDVKRRHAAIAADSLKAQQSLESAKLFEQKGELKGALGSYKEVLQCLEGMRVTARLGHFRSKDDSWTHFTFDRIKSDDWFKGLDKEISEIKKKILEIEKKNAINLL